MGCFSSEGGPLAFQDLTGFRSPSTPPFTIKERGRSSLACGEPEKNARAQVNLGRTNKPTLNQQQESTEEIGSASC